MIIFYFNYDNIYLIAAKINSIMGIISSIESMIYPTIYSLVYFSSKEVFIGAIFMLSEAFLLISLGFYV